MKKVLIELALQLGGSGYAGKISWIGGPDYRVFIDETINDGQWHNVVCVADGSVSYMYLDGVLKTTGGNKIQASSNTSDFHIGSRGGAIGIVGSLDEVAIWNKALSASEVSALSTASAPANILALSAKPIAYYPLGEQARRGSEWQFPNEVLQSQVFDFDGSTDFIEIPKNDALSFVDTDFSISIWLNPDVSHNGMVMMNYQGGVGGWGVYYNSGSIRFLSVGPSSWQTLTTISSGEWTHILIVGDDTGGNLLCYKNGVEVHNSAYALNITATSNNTFIGSERGTAFYFNGKLSNIALWESNQTANKDNIYNNGSPQTSYTVTPTAWYKLNATSNYAGLNPNWHNALDFWRFRLCGNINLEHHLILVVPHLSFSGWVKRSAIGDSTDAIFFIQLIKWNHRLLCKYGKMYRNVKVDFNVGSTWSFVRDNYWYPIGNDTDCAPFSSN